MKGVIHSKMELPIIGMTSWESGKGFLWVGVKMEGTVISRPLLVKRGYLASVINNLCGWILYKNHSTEAEHHESKGKWLAEHRVSYWGCWNEELGTEDPRDQFNNPSLPRP